MILAGEALVGGVVVVETLHESNSALVTCKTLCTAFVKLNTANDSIVGQGKDAEKNV